MGPRVEQRGGVRFICPVDADFGGTWIAVNEYGVSLCLLNGVGLGQMAPGGHPDSGAGRSRGLLIRELIVGESAGDCVLSLKQLDLNPYAPFTLVVLEPGRPAAIAEWNGEIIRITPSGDAHMPLTSSSFNPQRVRQTRLNEFARRVELAGQVEPSLLYWFHSSHSA